MVVGEFNELRLYTGLRLDYILRLWAPASAPCAIFAVAKLLVELGGYLGRPIQARDRDKPTGRVHA